MAEKEETLPSLQVRDYKKLANASFGASTICQLLVWLHFFRQ
jgi:hypothetical protein